VLLGLGGGRNVWRFHDGSDDRTMHHGYTVLYHRAYAETLPAEGGFMLCRAGRWGDQVNVSVIWPGDMDATFTKHLERFVPRGGDEEVVGVGGLPATVIQGMGLGPSGFPFYGADTGGYRHSPPDEELYIRWFQQTALSTVMQVGDSSSQTPWEYNADNGRSQRTLDLYRTSARLHLRLFPYLWSHAKRLHQDGRAIQRPIGLAYPELSAHPDDAYLLGDDILVAPVVERGARTKRVLFPPGEWVDAHSGERVAGPRTVEVDAPLERIPYYWRAGAPIPMLRPTIDTLSPTREPARVDSFDDQKGPLYVRLAIGDATVERTLWDGTVLTASRDGLELAPGTVFSADGAWVELIALGAGAPPVLSLDGAPLMTFSSTAALAREAQGAVVVGAELHAKIPPGAHRLTFAR
jgi:alpha-D-xyloside xylohydrolase